MVKKLSIPAVAIICSFLVLAVVIGLSVLEVQRFSSDSKPSSPLTLFNNQTAKQPNNNATFAHYAALGDSVAAGSGLAASAKASSLDKACARSPLSYPALLAHKVGATLVFAACGSATTSHLVSAQTLGAIKNPPQLDTAFAGATPDLVTVTLGANDTQWIHTIVSCYQSDCATQANSDAIDAALVDFKMKLHYDIEEINSRSHDKKPVIVLTSYYQLGSPSCLSSLVPDQVTSAEVQWLATQTDKLDGSIKTAASQFDNTRYVALNSSGHGLCDTAGRWVQGLGDPAPFHLTAAGEQAMANAIYSALR